MILSTAPLILFTWMFSPLLRISNKVYPQFPEGKMIVETALKANNNN